MALTRDNPKLLSTDNFFLNRKIAFTGTLAQSGWTRHDAAAAIEALRGTLAGSVTKSCAAIIVGTKTASDSKIAQANQLGVPIMDELDFFICLEDAGISIPPRMDELVAHRRSLGGMSPALVPLTPDEVFAIELAMMQHEEASQHYGGF